MGFLHGLKQIGNPVGYGVYMNCADIGLDVVTTIKSRKTLGLALSATT